MITEDYVSFETAKLLKENGFDEEYSCFYDNIVEALDMAIKALSKPSLSSNMAGQFQKIEGELVDWYETNGVDYCSGIRTSEAFEVPEGFYIKKK